LDAVLFGGIKRLMIFAPPQTGKTELASVRFPPFWLAHRPDDPVILTSYGASLAHIKSGEARSVVESPEYQCLFPEICTDQTSRSKEYWCIAGHRGRLLASGVGGPITGHGAVLGIIDDPFENWEQAYSQAVRDRVWNWYRSTFRTRVWEDGAIILIMCMPGNTRIMMAGGEWRSLDTIRAGELVKARSPSGKLVEREVTAVTSQGKAQVFTVRTGNHSVVATGNHPFLVQHGKYYEWVQAASLKPGDKVVVLGCYDGGENPRNLTEEDCWMLGFMYGDGWITHHPRKDGVMRWATCVARGIREDVNNRVLRYFEKRFRTKPRLKKREGYYRTEVASAGRWFESLGFRGTAKTKRIPDLVFRLPLEHRRAFIAGYVSADGHVDTHERANVVSVNRELLHNLKLLACGAGYKVSNIFSRPIVAQPPNSPKPINSVYNHVSFSLKNISSDQFVTKKVVSVELAGVQPVYDLTVDRTHNFIAEGCVVHNTRWHEDDLAGRLLQDQGDKWKVLRLPALAETQEERDENAKRLGRAIGKPDPLHRLPGEPLCPQRFSKETLESIKADVGGMAWAAEYQGVPRLGEGNRFKRDWFAIAGEVPAGARFVRYWDKAGTAGGGAYSAGVLLATADGLFYVVDALRGQWSSAQRERIIKQTAEVDRARFGQVQIWVEQEPGSGGKESAEATIRNLVGFPVFADRVTGSKDVRMEPLAAQAEAGNIKLIRGTWNWDWLEEMCAVPSGRYRDQADATAGAFNKLAQPRYGGTVGFVRVRR